MNFRRPKLIRITTVPISLDKLLGEQLTYMNQFYQVIAVSADEVELKKVANNYGVKYHHIEMTRKISIFQDVLALWKFYKFCKREKPSIVHSHTPKAGIVGMLGARLAGVPHRFHTVAGLPLMEATGLKRMILNAVEKLTYRSATKVYPNSLGLYNFILDQKFIGPKKLKVLGQGSSNGIDTSFFNAEHFTELEKSNLKVSLNITKHDFVFIYVGRMVGDKGINELVAAYEKFGNAQTKLLLVGSFENDLDPPNAYSLYAINNNENIIMIGYHSDVRAYLAIADVLVFPSYREGFPNVVMQAGSMGVPAIVTDINGCNEIITDGINGLIIPVKDVNKIFEAMQLLYSDRQLLGNLKSVARTEISSRFEQSYIWGEILKEYQSLDLSNDLG